MRARMLTSHHPSWQRLTKLRRRNVQIAVIYLCRICQINSTTVAAKNALFNADILPPLDVTLAILVRLLMPGCLSLRHSIKLYQTAASTLLLLHHLLLGVVVLIQ